MHLSALDKARVFRSAYLAGVEDQPLAILDVGSAIVDPTQHSNRDAMTNPRWTPTGLDIEPGLNVDVAVADPYDWREVQSASIDVVTCSEVFEHAEYFWVTIHEIARVLKPNGLAFITSPSSGPLHRFPVDCWRFYDDGLPAVARYGGLTVLEAQVQWMPVYRKGMQWRDASIVLQKPAHSPEGAAAAHLKNWAAKLILKADLTAADFASPPLAPAAQPSIIPPLEGKGAFAAREAELAREGGLKQKGQVVLRQVRDLMRTIGEPLTKMRY
ncbi:class I SAM-dependent methyltransferase [Enterovirga rhinocerotis]|uniref:Methyltransferase family protein n=1 Tax=Enterovirga rhinocerotis TaxID=1339210 RepID=A0A4R7CD26_9HYPH|nr:methyltransferase domain-containing protein [Enterovirga rhinocerotis]TDR94727.1 methyltransferase family protein [Enterovirga rhinocerotis]